LSPSRLRGSDAVEDWWVTVPKAARALEFACDHLFVLPRCISCLRGSLVSPCPDCAQSVFHRVNGCRKCGFALNRGDICGDCLTRKRPFEQLEFIGYYQPPFAQTLQAFKFHNRPGLAPHFARFALAMDRVARLVGRCDAVTYVPATPARLSRRGYNQSLLLAREIARRTRKPLVHALEKVRETPPQVGLNYGNRIQNLRGAFKVCLPFRLPVYKKTILLVDDIYTTGATVEACAKPLLRAGAANVYVLVLARSRNTPP
jgi:ComF family protein